MGLAMMPISTMGMNAVPMQLIGRASALSNTIRQVMGAVSVTIVSMVMQNNLNVNYARLSEQVNMFSQPSNDLVNGLKGIYIQSGLTQSEAQGAALSTIGGLVQRQAYVDAMGTAASVIALSIILAIILALFLKDKKKKTQESHEEDGSMAMMFE